MTAVYDHLYVYLCQKEALLKYFAQTFYYAVLCGRSDPLSAVLLCLKGNQKGRFRDGGTEVLAGMPGEELPRFTWADGGAGALGPWGPGVSGEAQRRPRAATCWHELCRPRCLWGPCATYVAPLTAPGPSKEGKVS